MYPDRHSAAGSAKLLAFVLGLFAIVTAESYGQVVFDFEEPSFLLGTVFGAVADPPQMPGDLVLELEGARMTVEQFVPGSGIQIFAEAIVGGAHDAFFESTPLQLNNINVRFDVTHTGFGVDALSLEFVEFSGVANLIVNGETRFIVDSLLQIPESVADGVSLRVETELGTPLSVLTLTGSIDTFEIGGQEMSIDNVSFVPEPASLFLLLAGAALVRRRRHHSRVGFRVAALALPNTLDRREIRAD